MTLLAGLAVRDFVYYLVGFAEVLPWARAAMRSAQRLARGVRTAIRQNATAYGYSVLATTTFGVTSQLVGSPRVSDIFLFVAGAGTAFGFAEALASDFFRHRVRSEPSGVILIGSAFGLVSVSAGLAAAAGCGWLLDGWAAWLCAPFAATVVYVVLEGLNLAIARRAEERSVH